jgi:LmbE family N-acetylglucosaminyl deacetylase
MIGIMISALFWNRVLDAPLPEAPRVSSHRVWESSFAPQSMADRNKEFYKYLVRPKKEPQTVLVKSATASTFNSDQVAGDQVQASSKKILIVAPHPDDEILCCTQTIRDHLQAGDDVTIVVVTNGDGKDETDAKESLDYGARRRGESLLTARKLGIPTKKVLFLGFPDGHLEDIEKTGKSKSVFTQLAQTMRTSIFPGTPYSWSGLQSSLKRVLRTSDPDIVYIPSLGDTHPDHQVVARAIRAAASTEKLSPEWNEYVVHFPEKVCTAQAVDKKKLELIRVFKSQRHDSSHIAFLEQFASCKEEFNVSVGIVKR